MSQTTIGINIEPHTIRYALVQFNGPDVDPLLFDDIPCESADESSFDAGLRQLADRINELKKQQQIDAIGLTVDSTCALSAHRIFPFNDPKMLKTILPQSLMDIWKIDETAQLSFEVCGFINNEASEEGGEDGDLQSGYDIHVINYPREQLKTLLDSFNRAQIDPHVAIPCNDAFSYLFRLFEVTEENWVILDIGEDSTQLYVCENDKIVLMRSMKQGLSSMDTAISEMLEIPVDEAHELRKAHGFVAAQGKEIGVYQSLVRSRVIKPLENVDPTVVSKACTQGLNILVAAIFQTMGNYVNQTHKEPSMIYLTGNGASVGGLSDWFSSVFDGPCTLGLPVKYAIDPEQKIASYPNVMSAALAASEKLAGACPLNLRHGSLAHKGNLAYLKDNKWLIASLVLVLLGALIFVNVSHAKAVQQEHDRLKAALEKATEDLFGEKMMKHRDIVNEIEDSAGFNFIPEKTAFSHFSWLSSNVNDNLSDVEMDFQSLDIDTQRKIVTIRADVVGDDGLPRFMQLLEQYECFPKEIPEPKTTKNKDKTSFTLRIDANRCSSGGDNE